MPTLEKMMSKHFSRHLFNDLNDFNTMRVMNARGSIKQTPLTDGELGTIAFGRV